jgi:hypothetical protein
VPTNAVPAKKSTFVIVAGATAVAFAERVTELPRVTLVPAVGAVRATVGAVTLTFAIEETAVCPFESVTLAVTANTPAAVGVQVAENGAPREVPTTVVATRNSTLATVAVPTVVAVAVNVVVVPRATLEPLVGAVSTAARLPGAAATLTLMAGDVTAVPFESVTRAVRTTVPAAAGVQLTL